ncbi:MAG: hypothetical protein KC466_09845, partial [Myxococcales bacterium]|nr:hypothetical protein [Myxococcales bacterium]
MRVRARSFSAAAAALFIHCAAGSAFAGPLLDKAVAYSDRWQTHHSPARGCRVEILYADASHTTVAKYDDLGDSTIWTGNYVAAESYRYAVTGNPLAKEYGLRAVRCLLDMEKVTGKPGFIARFVGPYEGPFAAYVGACTGDCHVVSGGEFDGDFWIGNTSSDQYLGWWYGLLHAYDFLLDAPEDEALREEIRGAVGRVIDTLRADGYLITDPDGTVSTAGPEIIGAETLSFHLVAAHIAGGAYADMMPQVYLDNVVPYFFLTWLPITRWYQYYAFHLGHMSQHMLMRLETFWPLLKFHRNQHRLRYYREIRDTQQVMFDYIA